MEKISKKKKKFQDLKNVPGFCIFCFLEVKVFYNFFHFFKFSYIQRLRRAFYWTLSLVRIWNKEPCLVPTTRGVHSFDEDKKKKQGTGQANSHYACLVPKNGLSTEQDKKIFVDKQKNGQEKSRYSCPQIMCFSIHKTLPLLAPNLRYYIDRVP